MVAPQLQQVEDSVEFPRPAKLWVASMMGGPERPGWIQWSGYAADDNDALLAVQNAVYQVWPSRYPVRHPIFSTADRLAKVLDDDDGDRKPHSLIVQFADQAPRPSPTSVAPADAANRETVRSLRSLLQPLLLVEPAVSEAIHSGQPVSVEWTIQSAHFYTGQTRLSACISARTPGGAEIRLNLAHVMFALLFDELERRPAGLQLSGSFALPRGAARRLRPWGILKFAADRARVLEMPEERLGKALFRLHFNRRPVLAERLAEVVKEQRAAAR
ncbi:hypothetical protein [Bosea sp. FBZP-16]|uniref:hypothetical protein n=1 Tax=Bosea sp. FBZP-16 TaxID=2065382 RepID=UPI000C311697|nr:hypothetical protein [Bosea sp. FBZP-16]